MSGVFRFSSVVSLDGTNPARSASVTVNLPSGSPASLYADPGLSQTLANPTSTDVTGFTEFFVSSPAVDLVAPTGTLRNVPLPTFQPVSGATDATGRPVAPAGTALSASSVAAGAALGTSPPASTIVGNDVRGKVSFGSGTSPTTGVALTVTVPSYGVAPASVHVTPATAATAALGLAVTSVTATSFVVSVATAPAASQSSGSFALYYEVIA